MNTKWEIRITYLPKFSRVTRLGESSCTVDSLSSILNLTYLFARIGQQIPSTADQFHSSSPLREDILGVQ